MQRSHIHLTDANRAPSVSPDYAIVSAASGLQAHARSHTSTTLAQPAQVRTHGRCTTRERCATGPTRSRAGRVPARVPRRVHSERCFPHRPREHRRVLRTQPLQRCYWPPLGQHTRQVAYAVAPVAVRVGHAPRLVVVHGTTSFVHDAVVLERKHALRAIRRSAAGAFACRKNGHAR